MPASDNIRPDDRRLEDRDDLDLLDAHLAGDPDAFVVLTRRYLRLMGFIARRVLHDGQDVEDVVQSALASMLRGAPTFDRRAAFRTWLSTITYNAALDVYRRRAARPSVPWLDNDERHPLSTVDVAAVAADRSVIEDLLAGLPEEARRIVVMVDLLDLDQQQVADILRLPVGTVKSRRFRALQTLARKLER
ncbi:RNA polymerase sigma factor [Actinomycetospora chibensis]|uniref:RNA polymerase sigma factor n=1 Tax=Actinomycetospora chibensis TaxID=663606 RepID=A0ABV9RFN4_9PSEU|nr:RNA polymerase sigma factor [Actinomycetospora chibensis]MDD7925037.1 RNA polymerase sigma factor [Actinomycetospora chibensis]